MEKKDLDHLKERILDELAECILGIEQFRRTLKWDTVESLDKKSENLKELLEGTGRRINKAAINAKKICP